MAGKPIDFEQLFSLVEQVMRICTQTTATSEALASLLIDKEIVTKAELDVRTEQCWKETKKLADTLGSFDGKES